jgi:hypothetical protein
MVNCCNLVGSFDIRAEGIISVSSKGNTPVQLITDGVSSVLTVAPSTGTVSISAYANDRVHAGCVGKAGVTVNWLTRTDCNNNIYLFGGAGKSYIQGDTSGLVFFPSINGISNPVNNYEIIDASSSSGPAAMYTKDFQKDGYGLIYVGKPWLINTTKESNCKINLSHYGIGDYGECMLQSMNLTFTPNQIPIVSLDFIYSIND